MSSNPLQQTIEALAKEKGIEPDVVITAIEEAVATASRKYYKTGENLKTRFNTETGQVDLFALKLVVQEVANPAIEIALDEARQMYQQLYGDDVANSIELGDEMEFPKPTEVLGRIAAQTAKQVIFQKVREAEREHVFAEYNERIGEVVNGTRCRRPSSVSIVITPCSSRPANRPLKNVCPSTASPSTTFARRPTTRS